MDNEEECKNILLTREGREQIVEFHVNAIVRTRKELFEG